VENFITGFPGREYQIREALAEAIGAEKAKFFFDKVSHRIWQATSG
jgi:VanZ family protein